MANIQIQFSNSESISDSELITVREKVTEIMDLIRATHPDIQFRANITREK